MSGASWDGRDGGGGGGGGGGILIRGATLAGRHGRFDVRVEGTRIASVTADGGAGVGGGGEPSGAPVSDKTVIEAGGRVLAPGFVDCHTHACWHDPDGSHRLDEWIMRLEGRPYLEILKAGGGILATVRAVRAASEGALVEQLVERVLVMAAHGTTTVEVKSGYGLTTEAELNMLRAVRAAGEDPRLEGLTVLPTALLGHAIDPDEPRERFVARTIDETLRAVHEEFPGIAIDAFCEEGAWSLEECTRLFEAGMRLGHPGRVHADQFNRLGMVGRAVDLGLRSVDHLEASGPEEIARLRGSETFAVGLPGCGFHLDGRYAALGELAGREVRAAGGADERLCIATNVNPGSAPVLSMPMVQALAVRRCGLTPAAALRAATENPARLLGLADRGRIEAGARADLVLLRGRDVRSLACGFGDNPVVLTVAGGRVVWRA